MTDRSSLIEFPCDFPMKIIGIRSNNFIADITAIIIKHYPETLESNIAAKLSQNGNYIAITTIIHPNSQQSLDELYRELTQYPDIKMVL